MAESIATSVVIPVYNIEKYVKYAIESVLCQSFLNFEVIIVDDGSSDRSIDICNQFSDPRIKIIRQANRGLSGARNTGIYQSSGKFIAFLDSDDLWLPNKLERHFKHLIENEEVGVSFSFSQFIDEDGLALDQYIISKITSITVKDLCKLNPVGNGSAAVFRRETLEAVKITSINPVPEENQFYDETLRRNEDYETLFRILSLSDWKIKGIPEFLTLYRVNTSGLSSDLSKQNEALNQVIEKIMIYNPKLLSENKNQLLSYHFRYLAQNALRLNLHDDAIVFANRSMTSYPLIFWEEPMRTIRTIFMAYCIKFLPQTAYSFLALFVRKMRKARIYLFKISYSEKVKI